MYVVKNVSAISRRARVPRSPESLLRALAGLARFLLAVARRGVNLERVDESARDRRHVVDRLVEGRFVGLRRLGRSAELAHELKRRGADLVVGGGGFEIRESFDVAAHG